MNAENNNSLAESLKIYQTALTEAEANAAELSLEQTIAVLSARDLVEESRVATHNHDPSALSSLVNYDKRLQQLGAPMITLGDDLAACRKSLNPPESAWWWSPVAAEVEEPPARRSFDWLWNALTITCLLVATSITTNTLQAFSRDGFDVLQTFSAVSQSAGLVLISGGALTGKGRKIISDILASLKISPKLQAPFTFLCSVVLLLLSVGLYFSLPQLGEYYYRRGMRFYQEGSLERAERNLKQAVNFAPRRFEMSADLGDVHSTLGNYDEAEPLYRRGAAGGHPNSLNGLGRVQLRTVTDMAYPPFDTFIFGENGIVAAQQAEKRSDRFEDLLAAETTFRVGLSQPDLEPALHAEMLAHLGFTLYLQAETTLDSSPDLLTDAETVLRDAVAVDSTITTDRQPGLGMSYCYLAMVLDATNSAEAADQWDACVANALPTSLDEYQDLFDYGERSIAIQVDTSGIVQQD